jgi:hypothetical protein
LERRTLAILRSAELGFFGVAVLTAVQTPRFCGALTAMERLRRELKPLCSAGAVDFLTDVSRPFLTSWLNVGILFHLLVRFCAAQGYAAVSFPMRFSLQNLPDTQPFFGKKMRMEKVWPEPHP